MSRLTRRLTLAGLALVGLGAAFWWRQGRAGLAAAKEVYAQPLSAPKGPLRTYHLGHSLVGRDMPAMLAQLADHTYESQLGWGTSLREHWEPDLPINGFDAENDHPRFRPAREAVGSGNYDAIVFTEMVELRDAIRYHDSAKYLGLWAKRAHEANPQTRVFLYETWHHTNDPEGWEARIMTDWPNLWRDKVLYPAIVRSGVPIHLIPAGHVMMAFAHEAFKAGDLGGITRVEDLFATNADGTQDTIHLNDLGAYLVALTHYAVLYHRSPVGLPHQLTRADGTPADAPSAEAANAMQKTVWRIVGTFQETGVAT